MIWTDDTEQQALRDLAHHKALLAEVDRIIAESRREDADMVPLREYSLYQPGELPPKVAGIDWIELGAWIGAAVIGVAGCYALYIALPIVGGWIRRWFG